MIEQGGVKLNGEKVSDRSLRLAAGSEAVLQVGKRKFAQGTNRVAPPLIRERRAAERAVAAT